MRAKAKTELRHTPGAIEVNRCGSCTTGKSDRNEVKLVSLCGRWMGLRAETRNTHKIPVGSLSLGPQVILKMSGLHHIEFWSFLGRPLKDFRVLPRIEFWPFLGPLPGHPFDLRKCH